MKKQYGIYEVSEEFREDGLWRGYKCGVVNPSGQKQGKLYIPKDGRDHYRKKPEEELEI